MQRTGRRDTSAEMAIRSELFARGLRYRIDMSVPGVPRVRPDILFTRAKVAVMIDGCFWHSCPDHGTIPKRNREWWIAKLAANRDRDERATALLQGAGWTVVRVWEHESPDEAAARISAVVEAATPTTPLRPCANEGTDGRGATRRSVP
jgi:DNA mismatch endonuclease (patch repair protein)